MPIVTGTSTVGHTGSSLPTSLTFAHNSDAGGSLLVVGVTNLSASSQTCDSVTFNGVSLTKHADASQSQRTTIWYLVNPFVGSANVVVSVSAGATIVARATTYKGADVNTPLRTAVTAVGEVSSQSLTPTSKVGDLVIMHLSLYTGVSTPVAPGSGVAERYDARPTTHSTALNNPQVWEADKPGIEGTTTIDASWTSNFRSPCAACAIVRSPTGGAPIFFPFIGWERIKGILRPRGYGEIRTQGSFI